MSVKKLQYFSGGIYRDSETEKFKELYDPSTGEVIAMAPLCTAKEVEETVRIAHEAYLSWSKVPPVKRAQVLYRVRELIIRDMDELTMMAAREHGKVWEEARGDILKAKEGTELACQIPSLMMGESLMDASAGFDTVLYREALGVFAGITPFNFPAMIPMGWMAPVCIAAGNAMVLKVSTTTPQTALHFAGLYKEAGLPDGVLNVLTCTRNEAELLLSHEDVRGISFVGSTNVGKHIYATAAAHGKRVQALCEAKNHALVLKDAPLVRTAAGIINSAYGCAGERCMALPVVVAEEAIADELVGHLVEMSQNLKLGPAYDKTSGLGPLVTGEHRDKVAAWIEKGVSEGARLVLDGRGATVPGYEGGFYLGPTIFDGVTEEMSIGTREIFGPVLCIKRVSDFEEGLRLMNNNPYANGSVIFTQNGYYAREFARNTDGGMVGVNVGIPVPVGVFPFTGHKNSFFGDLHCLGKDSVRFYTESKSITTRWFDEEEKTNVRVSTWDGTI